MSTRVLRSHKRTVRLGNSETETETELPKKESPKKKLPKKESPKKESPKKEKEKEKEVLAAIYDVLREEAERTDTEDEGEDQVRRFKKTMKRTTEAVLAAVAPFLA